MEYLLELDKKLFLKINSVNEPWLDQIMMFMTSTIAWIPLYLLLFYLLSKFYRKNIWLVLLAIILTILLTDQITSSLMKPFFARLRPSHEPSMEAVVNIVSNYRGGQYGFASSHAANTFGLATLMWLMLKKYRPWIGVMFLWAFFIGYTRIYLGVHYPGDILAGQFVGFLAGLGVYFLFLALKSYTDRRSASKILVLTIFLCICQ